MATLTDSITKKQTATTTVRTVHIDTSLQIERCKAPRKKQVIEDTLQEFAFKSTSSYARLEFKRAWLQRLAYLHKACREVKRDDELLGYVQDRLGSHPLLQRRLCTCIQAIESFLSEIQESLTPEARLLRLRSHIKSAILSAYSWWNHPSTVTHEYDGTHCVRAYEEPERRPNGMIDVSIPRCKPNKVKCCIQQFFEKNRNQFVSVKRAIENLGTDASPELCRAKSIIEAAEKNPKSLCNSTTCPKIGDVLIAIDGLLMDCFAANNDSEWQLLADVLDKELINPVRNAKATKQDSK